MNIKQSFIITLAMLLCSTLSFAGSNKQPVTFTRSTKSGIVMRPFSLVTPPEGAIENSLISIELNSSSLYALVVIYKDEEVAEQDVVYLCDTDGTISYDLSSYGNSNYRFVIAFSDGMVYEATVSTE